MVDWNSIRSIAGSQDRGFEELCCQLARTESPKSADYIRKGSPDAGVECYCILEDGSEWAWQAKYFHDLEAKKWPQIDESVKTALNKHPKLTRYYVCIPYDRPDARIENRKSALEKWEEHVEQWASLAKEKRMDVKFVYWGSSELIEIISEEEHAGKLFFWFNKKVFSKSWFNLRLNETIEAAGPRYTPEVHVDQPISKYFEAFGRTAPFFKEIKTYARSIRQSLPIISTVQGGEKDNIELEEKIKAISTYLDQLLTIFSSINVSPIGKLPLKDILNHIEAIESTISEARNLIIFDEKNHSTLRSRLISLQNSLMNTRYEIDGYDNYASSSLLLLKGAAGVGKTHLLCDLASKRITNKWGQSRIKAYG